MFSGAYGAPAGVVVDGNLFGRISRYGPWKLDAASKPGFTWTDNRWEDNNALIAAP